MCSMKTRPHFSTLFVAFPAARRFLWFSYQSSELNMHFSPHFPLVGPSSAVPAIRRMSQQQPVSTTARVTPSGRAPSAILALFRQMRFSGLVKRTSQFSLLFVALSAPLLLSVHAGGAERMSAKKEVLVYVGTAIYTDQTSTSIYAFRFNASTGQITSLGVAAESVNPGTLALHSNGRFLYATNEVGNYKGYRGGGVSAFAVDQAAGKLTFLNDEFSGGANPAYVVVDKTGKFALVANYYGGQVSVFPLQKDGRLGEATAFVHSEGSSVNKVRQEGPHPHSVYVSPDNRFVMVCDLGLDKILVYRFDATKGSLTPNEPPYANVNPGAGPRHLAFSPNGKFVYVVCELQSSVSAFSYDAQKGALQPLQTIATLPSDFKGENTGAEIEVSPSGKFLYASNRGHDSIAVFAIDAARGTLTPIEQVSTLGKTPRNFAIDSTGAYLFVGNQDSDNIVVFHIDSKSGQLKPTGQALKVVSPTCIAFLPLP